MERIHYAGASLLTGTDIARALLAYAAALALRRGSAIVEFPVRRVDGTIGRAVILIGPSSELVYESEEGGEEIVDAALVERFTEETAKLGVTRPTIEEGGPIVPHFTDVDLPDLDGGGRPYP